MRGKLPLLYRGRRCKNVKRYYLKMTRYAMSLPVLSGFLSGGN
jgi:hypothetical protein